MAAYQTEKLLIVTKTYPSPSKKYRETSCIAAINHNGELRRLFPIPFRLLEGEYQFKRWEWIEARITKSKDDHRPESYKVDINSINRLAPIGTQKEWAERLGWISPHLLENFNTLEEHRQTTNQTLGFIRPSSFQLEIKPSESPDWTPEEKTKLVQDGLFDSMEVKTRVPLRKIPYDFYYTYTCKSPACPESHKHKLTDWEIGALYWNCQRDHGPSWEKYLRDKIEIGFSQSKDIIFLLGTMHRFPDQWLIVGLIYPPKVEARQQVFRLPPGV